MSSISYFESRSGRVTGSAEKVYNFVTDLRNFEQFIPEGTINNWHSDRESCSFSVSMAGNVSLRITEKEFFNRVVYTGDALKKDDFSFVLHISGYGESGAEVKAILGADLNPMLKMMASKLIGQFMESLINEMERFRAWEEVKE